MNHTIPNIDQHGGRTWIPQATQDVNNLREAAIQMQATVALILAHGGLNIDQWFDKLVEAQQKLSSETRLTREESTAMRETLKIEYL